MTPNDLAGRNGQPDTCQICLQAPARVFRYFVPDDEPADRHAIGANDMLAMCDGCYDLSTYIRLAKEMGPETEAAFRQMLLNLGKDMP